MAKYKHTDIENGQGIFLSVNLKEQLLEGTFEHMLDELIGGRIDLSCFDRNYKNDKTGAPAAPPAALLKLVIYGYSKGANSSRKLQELNRNNIIAKALTGDIDMHWTTIAEFISGNGEAFKEVFVKVLAYCNELGLIGNETFAVDGCRLPSNASLDMTGTKQELEKRLQVYKRMAEKHMERHQRRDEKGEADEETTERYERRQKKLRRRMDKLSGFIETMEARTGKQGQEIRSNVTDNGSALIMSPQGYIQGYIGTAVADSKSQVIVSAQAFGSANECEHFPEMLEQTEGNLPAAGIGAEEGKDADKQEGAAPERRVMLADKNYWSEENFKAADGHGMEMITPDSQYKQRLGKNGEKRYEAADFIYHKEENYYECPCGKRLLYKGVHKTHSGESGQYQAAVADCRVCADFRKCVRTKKERDQAVKGKALLISADRGEGSYCARMREKMGTVEYQDLYTRRIQIIEPVFSDITYCKGLDRFTLRGRDKVNGQWLLYCMVHNAGKCLKERNRRAHCA